MFGEQSIDQSSVAIKQACTQSTCLSYSYTTKIDPQWCLRYGS